MTFALEIFAAVILGFLAVVLLLSELWEGYVFVMTAGDKLDGASRSERVFDVWPTLKGVFADWFTNMTFCTLYFLDWPANWKELVTGRMKRYKADPKWAGTRQYRRACWLCGMLNRYRPTAKPHC